MLIVGGTGFLGYHLARAALKKNWKVTSISIKNPQKTKFLKNVKYIFCDISKKNTLKKRIKENYSFVINAGGYIDHSGGSRVLKTHLNGLKNLCSLFLKKKIDCFVQIGSSVEYGNLPSPQSESIIKKPNTTTYAKSKFLATEHALKLSKSKDFPITVLRVYQAYGPKQKKDRLIPSLIASCLRNEKFPCTKGTQLRDFIYIDDVVESIFKCYKNRKAKGEIFNIGSAKPKKIRQIINLVKKSVGLGKPDFGRIKLRSDENLKLYPSINKAKKVLKWNPKTELKQGILKTINSYKKDN